MMKNNVKVFNFFLVLALSIGVFLPQAHAEIISSIEYAPDDWRYGDDGGLFDSYYNGTIFQPDLDYTVSSISLNVCTTNPSDDNATIGIYQASNLNGSSSDPFSEFSNVGSFDLLVPMCPNDGTATSTFPASVTSTGGTPFAIEANEYYAFVFEGGLDFIEFYDPQDYIFGITDVTDHRAIAYCNPASSFICGTTYFNQSGRTAVPSFSLEAVEIEGECSLLTLNICVQMALEWAFDPSDDVFDQFTDLKDDLKTKPPFGYFTSAIGAIEDFDASSTPQFSLATSSAITTYIFDPIRGGLIWLLIFAGLYWLYKRLTDIQI